MSLLDLCAEDRAAVDRMLDPRLRRRIRSRFPLMPERPSLPGDAKSGTAILWGKLAHVAQDSAARRVLKVLPSGQGHDEANDGRAEVVYSRYVT